MDAGFWHERWQLGEIGFHQQAVHPFLRDYFPRLNMPAGARVLVPLCGKSLDLLWLRQQGVEVVGVELSRQAVEEFCTENRLKATLSQVGELDLYQFERLQIFCGDFFALNRAVLGPISAVYDRAALVALPEPMRRDYARQLCGLLDAGTQLLTIGYAYDQQQMSGPPFAVKQAEIDQLFGACCQVQQLQSESALENHHKLRTAGLQSLREEVYLLTVR